MSNVKLTQMNVCKDCKHYLDPSFWRRITLGEFAEGCKHPDLRNEVTGEPSPCITMRILKCEKGRLFESKGEA